ncbi:hypothetical protein CC2G_011390 [Coprinopsis cinerea AmutBmut pab1-1]|nr:hypothetical protein CC2G_011390 [Coprinopsis cinerea AmutBmut pab1-1]
MENPYRNLKSLETRKGSRLPRSTRMPLLPEKTANLLISDSKWDSRQPINYILTPTLRLLPEANLPKSMRNRQRGAQQSPSSLLPRAYTTQSTLRNFSET